MTNQEKETLRKQERAKKKKEENTAAYLAIATVLPFFFYCMSVIFAETSFIEFLLLIPISIVFLPCVYIIGSVLHSCFFTGIIYETDQNGRKRLSKW